jgi:integrase
MAHIEKIKDEKGKVIAYKAVVETGAGRKRKRRTKTFKRSKDAEKWKSSMIVDQEEGTYIDPKKVTVKKFMLDWLENEKKPHIATTTYDGYYNRMYAYIFPRIGKFPVQQVEPFHISQFFAELRRNGRIRGKGGLSENTLKKIYVLLNAAFNKAVKFHLIKNNPVQALDSPQPEDYEAPPMKPKELGQLLKAAKDDIFMFTYILFALFTGMRKSEMLGLEWSNLDLENKTIEVKMTLVASQHTKETTKHEKKTKNKTSKRLIKMADSLTNALEQLKEYQKKMKKELGDEYYKKKKYVFCRPDGKNYYPTTITRKLKKLIIKAKLNEKYNVHTLRHSFTTIGSDKKINPKILQKMLGHSTILTTLKYYTHPELELQNEVLQTMEDVMKDIIILEE